MVDGLAVRLSGFLRKLDIAIYAVDGTVWVARLIESIRALLRPRSPTGALASCAAWSDLVVDVLRGKRGDDRCTANRESINDRRREYEAERKARGAGRLGSQPKRIRVVETPITG
jgi:hypothetical protein